MAADRRDKQPWYKDGLRFTCSGCGDCCTGSPGYVWGNNEEIAKLAALGRLSVEAFETEHVRRVGVRKSLVEYENGDCVFFDNKSRKCGVYSARPRQCRTWPFWDSNIRTTDARAEPCQVCPRSGPGRASQREQIQTELQSTHP